MYIFNRQGLSQTFNSTALSIKPDKQFKWEFFLLHSSGGLKKELFIGQDSSPLSRLKFELNKKICGAGTIEFAFLDFPIDADDYIHVFYDGVLEYRAIIDQTIDPKGGKAKLLPYSQRFSELLINNEFVDQTVSQMLQTIVEDLQSDTGIIWLSGFIDTGSSATFSKDFSGYTTAKKAIDEIVSELDDREWGSNSSNIFTVYQPSTVIDEVLLYGDDPYYTEIDQNIDYSKIKATRYQVFKKKSGSGETEWIDEVGYGGSYPTLDIENLVRKKVKKFTVSELIASDADAADFAYAHLKANAITPETIKAKNFRFDRLFPKIGKRYQVQDRVEYIRRQVINCDALTADDDTFDSADGLWNGATIDTSDFTIGTGSATFTSAVAWQEMKYTFGKDTIFLSPKGINFMIKSTIAGNYLSIEVTNDIGAGGDGTWSSGSWSSGAWSQDNSALTGEQIILNKVINIPTGGVWTFIEFPFTDTRIKHIRFYFNQDPPGSTTINVDNIGLFLPHRKIYDAPVVLASFDIKKDEEKCDLKLNDYDLFANDALFVQERDLEKLKAAQQDD